MKKKTNKLNLGLAYSLVGVMSFGLVLGLAMPGSQSAYLAAQVMEDTTSSESQNVSSDETKNHQNHIKNQNSYVKSAAGELKRAGKAGVDTSAANDLLNQFKTCVESLTPSVGTFDFWNNWNDCNIIYSDLENDYMRDVIRPAIQFTEWMASLKNRKSEYKNISRNMKEYKKSTIDISELQTIYDRIGGMITEGEGLKAQNSSDVDRLREINDDLNFDFQEFYALDNELREQREYGRKNEENAKRIKDYDRQCSKDAKRQVTELEKEVARVTKNAASDELNSGLNGVRETYQAACSETGALARMKAAITAKDPDAFEDARQEFDDAQMWSAFDELRSNLNDIREQVDRKERKEQSLKQVERDAKQSLRDVARMKKENVMIAKKIEKLSKKYLDKDGRSSIKEAMLKRKEEINALLGVREADVNNWKKQVEESEDGEYYGDEDGWTFYDEVEELRRELQMTADGVAQLAQVEQGLKGAEKEIAQFKADGFPQEILDQMAGLVKSTKEGLSEAWALIIDDPEGAMDVLMSGDFEGIGQQFEELREEGYEFLNGDEE